MTARTRNHYPRLLFQRLCGFLVAILLLAPAHAARQLDYFTDLEIHDIRMAQEIAERTETLLWIAERRLLELAPEEDGAEDADEEPGFGATVGRGLIRILNPEGAAEIDALEQERAAFDDDLSGHSRADLLAGYVQALEETMDNIDDAWERNRGDVRGPVEMLSEFAAGARARLEQFEWDSESERIALNRAIEETELVIEGVTRALETISER